MKLILLVVVLLAGCANQTKGMTAEEKEFYYENRDTVDATNWANCQIVYNDSGLHTIHTGHEHDGRHPDKHKPAMRRRHDRKDDLRDNVCKMVISDEYWLKY